MQPRSLSIAFVTLVAFFCLEVGGGNRAIAASHAHLTVDFPRSPLRAGAAERRLDLPVGLPLSGYTARMFMQAPDDRWSPYTTRFAPSIGIADPIWIKAVVLQNDEETIVFLKLSLIYVSDALLFAVEARVREETGIDLTDKIVLACDHSHSSYGTFWDDWVFFLGHDRYKPEIFDRMVAQLADTVIAAYERLAPARIGFGFDPAFDPAGEIFTDRREENDVLGPNGELIWGNGGERIRDDIEPRGHTKDDRLSLIRIDDATGKPLALLFVFGMHGTVLEEENLMISGDAGAAIEYAVQETFEHPVVTIFLQGAGGDMSPRGDRNGAKDFDRLRILGETAAPRIRALFDRVETEDLAEMEIVSRQISMRREDIRTRREGEELAYGPPLPRWRFDGDYFFTYEEWNFPQGASLCGDTCDTDPETIKGEGLDNVYLTCVSAAVAGKVLPPLFGLPPQPFPEAEKHTRLTAIRLNGHLLLTLPGEPISILSDELRGMVPEAFGPDRTIVIGYAQDHEGYLLTRFDWLQGGGAEIVNMGGPLFGEYVVDQSVELARLLTTPEREDPGGLPRPVYPVGTIAPVTPERTTRAGTIVQDETIERPDATPLVVFEWIGGDPVIDAPRVVVERLEGEAFAAVHKASGRILDDADPAFHLHYTPVPVRPRKRQERDHHWRIEWSIPPGFPAGTYRLRASGRFYDGTEAHPPFEGVPYSVTGHPFPLGIEDDPGKEGGALHRGKRSDGA